MLLRQSTLAAIRDGRVTLAFRRWKRPTVRAGGSLLTAAGKLAIGRIEPVDIEDVTEDDARRAGFAGRAALIETLGDREGQLYRVELGALTADPRVALRERRPDTAEVDATVTKLRGMDARAERPWTLDTLRAIGGRPGVRAADLATSLGFERLPFKANVRKLKALGLTVSLEVGYELSPRGKAVLAAVEPNGAARDGN